MPGRRITFSIIITIIVLAVAITGCDQIVTPDADDGAVQEGWVSRYDADSADDDGGQALALDSLGNIYVTGYSWGNDTRADYATIKYDSDGNRLWVARYDGPASDEDWALDLVVDNASSAYVTGWSLGSGTEADCATIKYDSDGKPLWVARYDGPVSGYDLAYAIALDYSGNVHVTGWSQGNGTNADCATIKYDSDGNQLWVARYDGPVSGEDKNYALTVDGWANVYTTGSSHGNGTRADIITTKYDSEGNQLWVARYNGPADADDRALSVVVDHWGNVYVAGWSNSVDSGEDYVTLKYSGSGDQLWSARYDGPAHEDDGAEDMALDTLGNIYVTGASRGNNTEADYATVKYDSDGNRLWVARYDGPARGEDTARVIALDGFGNAYVSGWSRGVGVRYDFATVKYDADGSQLWAIRYDGPAGGHDKVYAMALENSGGMYVTGRSSGETTYYDYTTIRYQPR